MEINNWTKTLTVVKTIHLGKVKIKLNIRKLFSYKGRELYKHLKI